MRNTNMFNKEFNELQKPQALVRVWKSQENRISEQGVLYATKRGTGHMAILGTGVSCTNLVYKGREIKTELFSDISLEVRIDEDELQELISIVSDYKGRLFEILVDVDDVSLGSLTVKGAPANAFTIFGTINACREVAATLQGDDFDSQDELDNFLKANRSNNITRREDYRSMLAAATVAANVNSAAPINALA